MATAEFNEWVGRRRMTTLGTNNGAPPLAFQGWHRFKEAFPPEIVHRALRESPVPVSWCLDACGGSGTTALAARLLGISSTTIEVNPFLADVIKAKVQTYEVEALARSLLTVRRRARQVRIDAGDAFADLPATFIEPGHQGRWLFSIAVAERVAAIMAAIDALDEPTHRRLFRVLLGGLLVETSNAVVSGKGRRYRRGWQQREQSRAPGSLRMMLSRARLSPRRSAAWR